MKAIIYLLLLYVTPLFSQDQIYLKGTLMDSFMQLDRIFEQRESSQLIAHTVPCCNYQFLDNKIETQAYRLTIEKQVLEVNGAYSIKGKLKDSKTIGPLRFVAISLWSEDSFVSKTSTTYNGDFSFESLPLGDYEIKMTYAAIKDRSTRTNYQWTSSIIARLSHVYYIDEVPITMVECSLLKFNYL